MNAKDKAEILFPEIKKSISDYTEKYPKRNLKEGAIVTRFAPSPTGFVHAGALFTALVSERIAHQTEGGVFFLRIEDTDKKREVEGTVEEIVKTLLQFGIKIDEGEGVGGSYAPYLQSERKEIYKTFAKHLVENDLAYPCFCTAEELDEIRKEQENLKIRPGYYGKWAKCRHLAEEEIEKNLAENKPFVLRLRADKNFLKENFEFSDKAKGSVSVTENDLDIVLIKTDGLPTYHFAHLVDDYLMGTTLVIRSDEWLSSLGIHLQLFRTFGFKAPKYAHISPILKLDNGNKRKLSKRKDPEAAVEYYFQEGYPKQAIVEYFLNIANSDFEPWRRENPFSPNENFEIKLSKFSKSGALFDLEKFLNVSKEIIAKMTVAEIYPLLSAWAEKYDLELKEKLEKEEEYFKVILNIERNGDKPRKDFGKWSDVKESVSFFFDDWFLEKPKEFLVNNEEEIEVRKKYAEHLEAVFNLNSKEEWFEDLKVFGEENGYTFDRKAFKENSEHYKGAVGDLAMILRIALSGRKQTPDLFEMMKVMGRERVEKRFLEEK